MPRGRHGEGRKGLRGQPHGAAPGQAGPATALSLRLSVGPGPEPVHLAGPSRRGGGVGRALRAGLLLPSPSCWWPLASLQSLPVLMWLRRSLTRHLSLDLGPTHMISSEVLNFITSADNVTFRGSRAWNMHVTFGGRQSPTLGLERSPCRIPAPSLLGSPCPAVLGFPSLPLKRHPTQAYLSKQHPISSHPPLPWDSRVLHPVSL